MATAGKELAKPAQPAPIVNPMPKKPSAPATVPAEHNELRDMLLNASWTSLLVPAALVATIVLVVIVIAIFSE